MKILLIFVIFAVCFSLPINDETVFNDIFEEALSTIKSQSYQHPFDVLKTASRQCISEKLKLKENGHKLVPKKVGVTAVVSAATLCIEDKNLIYGKTFDQKVEQISSTSALTNKIDCIKKRLKELQPDSDLLDGFDENNMENDENVCSQTISYIEYGMALKFDEQESNYKAVGINHCVNRNVNESKIHAYRLLLLIYTQPENADFLKIEKQNEIARGRKLDEKSFKCILSIIEEKFQIEENVVLIIKEN
ncbi:hypothetical protein PVAND_014617 [Polypedilum vanderplanki]|uniref:Uncharacterized protein n=1 Tax=Polypedilum vanderplanki TaxID=319348 RepID=A0A9J6BA93_POLVA|nr:hypothetical protein PVAND_014617 [Polypedilum vanderplanki]